MTAIKRPLRAKSITTLLLVFLLGGASLFSTYYVLSYKTIQHNKAQLLEVEQLDVELQSLDGQQIRLEKSPFPTSDELQRYANLVPNNADELRFLRSLDTIAKSSGIQFHSIQINQHKPISEDLLNKLLVLLEERKETLTTSNNNENTIDIVGNLLAQLDEQYRNPTVDNVNGTSMLVDDGALQRVVFNVEFQANDPQVKRFLQQVRQLERTTYVDTIELTRSGTTSTLPLHFNNADIDIEANGAPATSSPLEGKLQITAFYYNDNFTFIPNLP